MNRAKGTFHSLAPRENVIFKRGEAPFGKFKRTKVRSVPIDKLHATQDFVSKGGVSKYRSGSKGSLPTVIKDGDRYFIDDGHHRATAAKKRGQKTITARVKELCAKVDSIIEFSYLGHPGPTFRRPMVIGIDSLKPMDGLYDSPTATRMMDRDYGVRSPDQARKGGVIGIGVKDGFTPKAEKKAIKKGFRSLGDAIKATKRHELIHAIQEANRGYRTDRSVRQRFRDEYAAYSQEGRRGLRETTKKGNAFRAAGSTLRSFGLKGLAGRVIEKLKGK